MDANHAWRVIQTVPGTGATQPHPQVTAEVMSLVSPSVMWLIMHLNNHPDPWLGLTSKQSSVDDRAGSDWPRGKKLITLSDVQLVADLPKLRGVAQNYGIGTTAIASLENTLSTPCASTAVTT